MPDEMQILELSPTDHQDSVRSFLDYYRLQRQTPNLSFLQKILESFAQIPYENISKIVKLSQNWGGQTERIRLPGEVIEDHISSKLGGTCFSLTFFLQSILVHHGFDCYPVMADMRAGRNIHCGLIVIFDAVQYLVDPGYLLTQPMKINSQKPKLHRSEFAGIELRYDRRHDSYDLFTFNKHETKWRYRLQDRAVHPSEFLEHWLASFGWNSMHGICLTKVMPGGIVYVHKNFMRETCFDGKQNFNIRKNYHTTIRKVFGIDQQIVEQGQAALEENLMREREVGLCAKAQGSSFIPGIVEGTCSSNE